MTLKWFSDERSSLRSSDNPRLTSLPMLNTGIFRSSSMPAPPLLSVNNSLPSLTTTTASAPASWMNLTTLPIGLKHDEDRASKRAAPPLGK